MSELSTVYVLTNSAMPGLVKIGRTDQDDANVRIGQLYSTGVPVPFNLEFACRVEKAAALRLVGDHGLAAFCRALFNANEFLFVD